MMRRYWTTACGGCALKAKCTTSNERRISRWEHEHVLEAVQERLDIDPQAMRRRRETVEHPFGTMKMRMGATHFLLKTLPRVASETALHVLAYNLTRVMNIGGVKKLMEAVRAWRTQLWLLHAGATAHRRPEPLLQLHPSPNQRKIASRRPIRLAKPRRHSPVAFSHNQDPFEIWAETGAEAGEYIDYPDNATADGLRQEMHRVNEALDAADIAFVGSTSNKIDVGDRWLRRAFSNGWDDLRHGGRLAGGFWMDLPSEHRRAAIRLNGEKVAELDYGSMAMRLLYARSKRPMPAVRDPYFIADLPSSTRDGVKMVLASLLFGDTAFRRWPKGCAPHFKGLSRQDVIAAVLREHTQVRDMLGTMVGFDLTRTESDIMVAVLLRIIDGGASGSRTGKSNCRLVIFVVTTKGPTFRA